MNIVGKIFRIFLCLFGFSYHGSQLFSDYMSGKTIVSLSVGRLQNESIPSLTLCLPYFLSMRKSSHYNSTFANIFQDYKKIIDEYGNNYSKYPDNTTRLFAEMHNQLDLDQISVYKLLRNFSIPYKSRRNGAPLTGIELKGVENYQESDHEL